MSVTDSRTAAPDKGRGPGRPRKPDIDKQILAATLALIDADEPVTVAGIIAASGISRAALYRRWPSLTTLIAAALDTGREQPDPIPTDGDLRENILAAILTPTTGTDVVNYPEERLRQRIRLTMTDRALQQTYWKSHISRRRTPLEHALRAGINQGILRKDLDVEACTDLIAGVFYYQFVVRGARIDDPTTRTRCHAALEVALRGMVVEDGLL